MSKIFLVVIIALSSIASFSQQSFEKKTNVIAFGADVGIYNYTSKILSTGETNSDKAANKQLSLYYERGVLNWLGMGAKVQLSDYFTDPNVTPRPSFKAIDATLLVNSHLVRPKYFDLVFGFNVGYSSMTWDAHDTYVSTAKGGGLTYDVHLQPHLYFGKHIGMFINLAYISYSYKNMDFENNQTKITDVLDLYGGGVNFGIGLQAKF